MKKIVLAVILIITSTQAISETSLVDLKIRSCRTMVDSISKRLDRLEGTTLQRADFIDTMADSLTNAKYKELYLDTARQYEYCHTDYRKWTVAFEYCTDHYFDDAYH